MNIAEIAKCGARELGTVTISERNLRCKKKERSRKRWGGERGHTHPRSSKIEPSQRLGYVDGPISSRPNYGRHTQHDEKCTKRL
jgi:hypothetical protein